MIADLYMLADTAMSTGISAEVVGTIIASVVVGLGGAGYGVVQRARAETQTHISNNPLSVRDADQHYVTAEQHDRDLRRVYDQINDVSGQLNQLIGLVTGIRDNLLNRHPHL